MPRQRPSKKLEKLLKEEIETMEALGYDQAEMNAMQDRLNANTWSFESRAKTFRLGLSYEPDLLLKSGKTIENPENLNAKFYDFTLDTRQRRVAFLIYTSDAFRDLRVWDASEAKAERKEEKYREFFDKVKQDPEQLERLKADLAAEAAL